MRKFFTYTVLLIILVFALYLAFLYYKPYSTGYRSGELIKFSKKGVIVKTWEGEISQGISGAQIFEFSVYRKDKDLIDKLNEYNGEYVKVKYDEHYRKFFWWGDTRYFITEVKPDNTPFGRTLERANGNQQAPQPQQAPAPQYQE